MSNYVSRFTIFRDDNAPIRFVYRDCLNDPLNGMTISRTNEQATEDMHLIAMLAPTSAKNLIEWSFDYDAQGEIVFTNMEKEGAQVKFATPRRTDFDMKIVKYSPKGKATCVALLTHHQVGRLQARLERIRVRAN